LSFPELVRSVSSVIGQTAPDVLLDDLSPVKAANPGFVFPAIFSETILYFLPVYRCYLFIKSG